MRVGVAILVPSVNSYRIAGVGVRILVTIVAFGLSDPVGTPKLTGIVGVGFAILATVNAFRSSDPPLEFERITIEA